MSPQPQNPPITLIELLVEDIDHEQTATLWVTDTVIAVVDAICKC